MSEEVHHRIKDDTRCRMLVVDILREFHDTVGFTTQSSDGCGIVEGIACDGQAIETPETHRHLSADIPFNGCLPRKGIEAVDEDPYTDDGYQPITCMTEVIPQLDETHIERQQHHNTCRYSQYKEQVIESLLRPLHVLAFSC